MRVSWGGGGLEMNQQIIPSYCCRCTEYKNIKYKNNKSFYKIFENFISSHIENKMTGK
jgi:hypothetical protein